MLRNQLIRLAHEQLGGSEERTALLNILAGDKIGAAPEFKGTASASVSWSWDFGRAKEVVASYAGKAQSPRLALSPVFRYSVSVGGDRIASGESDSRWPKKWTFTARDPSWTRFKMRGPPQGDFVGKILLGKSLNNDSTLGAHLRALWEQHAPELP